MAGWHIGIIYAVFTLFLLLAVLFTPRAGDSFVLVFFNKETTFSDVAGLAHAAHASIVQEGAIGNSYVLYSTQENFIEQVKAENVLFTINPLYLNSCSGRRI